MRGVRRPPADMAVPRADGLRTAWDGTGLVYHRAGAKWYGDWAPVALHEALLDAARTGSVPSAGAFARVGEQLDDIEYDTWTADPGNLPDPCWLLSVEHVVTLSGPSVDAAAGGDPLAAAGPGAAGQDHPARPGR